MFRLCWSMKCTLRRVPDCKWVAWLHTEAQTSGESSICLSVSSDSNCKQFSSDAGVVHTSERRPYNMPLGRTIGSRLRRMSPAKKSQEHASKLHLAQSWHSSRPRTTRSCAPRHWPTPGTRTRNLPLWAVWSHRTMNRLINQSKSNMIPDTQPYLIKFKWT